MQAGCEVVHVRSVVSVSPWQSVSSESHHFALPRFVDAGDATSADGGTALLCISRMKCMHVSALDSL